MEPNLQALQRLAVSSAPQRQASPTPDAPEIQPSELELHDKIGEGCFGAVFRGRCRGKEVAVKKLFRQSLPDLQAFRREVSVMAQLRHGNVCLLMGACTAPGQMAIVTELCSNGDLYSLLHSSKPLSVATRLRIAYDIALGMNWLHCSRPPILHRDLKPKNILFDEHMTVKICDLGLAVVLETDRVQDREGLKGTPLWMAPEVLQAKAVDTKSDVYAYGLVVWEILTRQEPFEDVQDYRTFKRMVCRDNERPPIPADCHPDLRQLITESWARDPVSRPTFSDILRRLGPVIINVALNDDRASTFWLREFGDLEKVEWRAFARALCRECNIDETNIQDPQLRCIQVLLAEVLHVKLTEEPLRVTAESFGCLIAWFGPFEPTMPGRIRAAMQQEWFHGLVSKDEAEGALCNNPEGSFLVRLSSTSPGCFTISKVSRTGRINHQRIDFHPIRGFMVQFQLPDNTIHEVRSQESLERFLALVCDDLFLRIPVANARYRKIFDPQSSDGYLQVDQDS